jgi:hypothetical protein
MKHPPSTSMKRMLFTQTEKPELASLLSSVMAGHDTVGLGGRRSISTNSTPPAALSSSLVQTLFFASPSLVSSFSPPTLFFAASFFCLVFLFASRLVSSFSPRLVFAHFRGNSYSPVPTSERSSTSRGPYFGRTPPLVVPEPSTIPWPPKFKSQ